MSSFACPITASAPFARSVAIAALMGATMLAGPLTSARADTAAERGALAELMRRNDAFAELYNRQFHDTEESPPVVG